MLHALGWHGLIFVDTVGHCAGAVLFGLLIALLLSDPSFRRGHGNRLSLSAAVLVFVWNVTELLLLGAGPSTNSLYSLAAYLSFCCLSILPAVLLHISLGGRLFSVAAVGYAVSAISILSQYPGTSPLRLEQSRFSLLLLTFGFAMLSLGAWLPSEFLARRQGRSPSPNRVAFLSLFILATSYFHFQSGHTSSMWVGEAIWHHASIPIALLVLLGDYRFFLLDVFLRFIVSACWVALWIWAIYVVNFRFRLAPLALQSDFHRGLAITALCIVLYLLSRSLQWVQRVLTSVAFHRPPLEPLIRSIQNATGASEQPLLLIATEAVALHYKSPRFQALIEPEITSQPLAPATVVEVSLNPQLPFRQADPEWAILSLSLRFIQGDGAKVLFGPREGGRRFLSEDLPDLQKIGAALVERVERLRNEEIALLAGQAELRALQAQINPHFLFNALNTLYGIIGRHSPEARQMVLNLAEVFRARLQTNRTYVALTEEIDLVRAYLDIEQLRLGTRLTSSIQVDAALSQFPVPVLTIQPLIENAVRYGADGAGAVRIVLTVQASGDAIQIVVQDHGSGFRQNAVSTSTGTGLDNVRKRLALCYGPGHTLDIHSSSSGARVSFRVPTKVAPRAAQRRAELVS